MTDNIKYILLAVILLLFSTPLRSQIDKNGGSLYSIFGLGDLNYSAGQRTDAMGIMGIGLYGNYSNSYNPASWARIQSTRFTTKFRFERIHSSDGTNTAKRNYGNFEGFALSILLNRGNGWVFDAGLNDYSIVNYDITQKGKVISDEYTQTYSGNGGLSKISAGFSYIVFRYFSVGAQFNYVFGNIEKTVRIDFNNPSIFDTRDDITNSISGYYFNTGLNFHGFGKLLGSKKLNNMTLGVFFSTPGWFTSKVTGRFQKSTNIDSVNFSEGDISIPWALGAGISNEFADNSLIIAGDVFFQKWDDYKYYGSHPPEIKNSFRVGLGAEYTPSKKYDDPIYKRVSYRLGANYTSDYLKINGKSINAIGLNAGLSIPISRFNSIDLFFTYYRRGTTSNGLIKDDVYKLGASVNIGELWFLKPKEE
jgi:hypothetical protein